MKQTVLILATLALTACGVETATTAATSATMKKQELDAGKNTMQRAQEKIDAAAKQIQVSTERQDAEAKQ